MSSVNLLDCTLRDGGYINNWNFGFNTIKNICNNLLDANMDIIEIGFLTDKTHTTDDSLYYNCDEMEQVLRQDRGNTLIAAMIAIGEKEMNPESLPKAENTVLDIVRITFHHNKEEIEKAVSYARCLMEKGYKVCMQPVGTTIYKDKDLLELIEIVNDLNPYAFYLVDTLGTLYKKELLKFLYLIDYNLNANIKLGFHSHNNLQMSYANAQMILEYHSAREFLIDCSLFGMGRGAGNLCTELITQYMNTEGITAYDMIPIMASIDDYINPIYLSKSWGYSAHYYMAAVHNCHPNYASYLMNKQTLNMNQIDLILRSLPMCSRHIFNKELAEQVYYQFQSRDIDDEIGIEQLRKDIVLSDRTVLILAPGKTILDYKKDIDAFILEEMPIIISINGSYKGYKSDYIFLSNQKRMYGIDYENYNGGVIITSNLPKLREEYIYVDYDKLANQLYQESDNAGLMLIRLLANIGMKKIYVAGFDGFELVAKNNYYARELINNVSPEFIAVKNYSIGKQLSNMMKIIDVEFLTPSLYLREDFNELSASNF